jgi:hypothetical protein
VRWTIALTVTLVASLSACLPDPPVNDAGMPAVDGGTPDAGSPDTGAPADAGRADSGPADAGEACDQNTVKFGPDCPAEGCRYGESCGETGCGTYLCSQAGPLECFYDEANDCGGCDALDTAAGELGTTCGEFRCGTIGCNADGSATLCIGDHPLNVCGGCIAQLPRVGRQCIDDSDCGDDSTCIQDPNSPFSGRFCSPGGPCATTSDQCGTGQTFCGRNGEQFVCFGGRSPTTCGGCDQCTLYRADMDQRFAGSYILNGTVGRIDNVAAAPHRNIVVFDPLRLGEGADALPVSSVYLRNQNNQLYRVGTFAQAVSDRPPEYFNSWPVPNSANLSQGAWELVIIDQVLGEISAGTLIQQQN